MFTKFPFIRDGAMGTLLQQKGLPAGLNPVLWNLKNPEEVYKVHQKYLRAGAEYILTNTFGANLAKLREVGGEKDHDQINQKGVDLARKAVGTQGKVIGDIGPTGILMEPFGDLDWNEAYQIFYRQAQALKKADVILIETMSDIQEAKIALIAAREATDLPIWVSLTYEKNGHTLTGTPPQVAAPILEAAGADAIGANCGLGPELMLPIAQKIREMVSLPVFVFPNAGMPKYLAGETVFDLSPNEFADHAIKFLEIGVHGLGGCCGTSPEHIKVLAEKISNWSGEQDIFVLPKRTFSLASRTECIASKDFPLIIGERINPTNRKELTAELEKGEFQTVRSLALQQVSEGAKALDVNVGVAGLDERETLPRAIKEIQKVVSVPLVIDTANYEALELALKEVVGKPLINSTDATDDKLEKIFPLAKKYGAALIGLTLDEKGVFFSAEKRLKILDKLIQKAEEIEFPYCDLVIDPLTLSAASEKNVYQETLKAVRGVKSKGFLTNLGVSNISHGLPERDKLTGVYFGMALGAGLDLAIINPGSQKVQEVLSAVNIFEGKMEQKSTQNLELTGSPLDKIRQGIIWGFEGEVLKILTEKELSSEKVLQEAVLPAMQEVGRLFDQEEYYLFQVLKSAEIVKKVQKFLEKGLKSYNKKEGEKVILATVKGDVHDLGKNMVGMMLSAHGFKVYDLGKNVSQEEIYQKMKAENINIVGLSALMTTTLPAMEETISFLNQKVIPDLKVVIGGAVVTKDYADKLGVYYAPNAREAVKVFQSLINN